MIDELDRCRPSYAIEMLEVAKHLFSVEAIIFVLAINRTALGHSVKAVYGQDFKAGEYLKRFIDIDFQLPKPSKKNFILNLLVLSKINEYYQISKQEMSPFVEILTDILGTADISLRQISQAIHRISIVLASLQNTSEALTLATFVAIILRTIDEKLYREFRLGKAPDMEVIDTVFPGKENSSALNAQYRCQFEGAIIRGYENISGQSSVLRKRYEEIQASIDTKTRRITNYQNHANTMLTIITNARHQSHEYSLPELKYVIDRIELLSGELKKN